ncbi:unnamed protein product [Amoebophrya sp. A120]|nr:unnamed protein product [Amoebophrya sp. A120]|eukprot:GSA120T00026300001.1
MPRLSSKTKMFTSSLALLLAGEHVAASGVVSRIRGCCRRNRGPAVPGCGDQEDPLLTCDSSDAYADDTASGDDHRVMSPDVTEVVYGTDWEGMHEHFCEWFSVTSGITSEELQQQNPNANRVEKKADCVKRFGAQIEDQLVMRLEFVDDKKTGFVFGGDLTTRGNAGMRLAKMLVEFKTKYPKRVMLIIGNRDINQMWHAELDNVERDNYLPGPWYHPNAKKGAEVWLNEKEVAKPNCGLAAKYQAFKDSEAVKDQEQSQPYAAAWFGNNTGAGGDFKFRGEEIKIMTGVQPTGPEVAKSFQEHVDCKKKTGKSVILSALGLASYIGVFCDYLKAAQLVLVHGGVLYTHGQPVLWNSNKQWITSIGYVPVPLHKACTAEGCSWLRKVDTLSEWVAGVNNFAKDQVEEFAAANGQPLERRPKAFLLGNDTFGAAYLRRLANEKAGASLGLYGQPFNMYRSVAFNDTVVDLHINDTVVDLPYTSIDETTYYGGKGSEHIQFPPRNDGDKWTQALWKLLDAGVDGVPVTAAVMGHKPVGYMPMPYRIVGSLYDFIFVMADTSVHGFPWTPRTDTAAMIKFISAEGQTPAEVILGGVVESPKEHLDLEQQGAEHTLGGNGMAKLLPSEKGYEEKAVYEVAEFKARRDLGEFCRHVGARGLPSTFSFREQCTGEQAPEGSAGIWTYRGVLQQLADRIRARGAKIRYFSKTDAAKYNYKIVSQLLVTAGARSNSLPPASSRRGREQSQSPTRFRPSRSHSARRRSSSSSRRR